MLQVKTAVRVISLKEAVQRQRQFAAHTANASLDWEFFPAIEGPDPSLDYDIEATIRIFGRPLTDAELGCYGSHVSLWRWFSTSKYDQLFVFEDDVAVDSIALEKLARYNLSMLGIDILRMFSTHRVRMSLVVEAMLSPHSHLFQIRGKIFGTQAYCLTRESVKVLLSVSDPVKQPIDWLMMKYWDYRIANFAIFPFPLFERQFPSSIDTSAASGATARCLRGKVLRARQSLRDRAVREWVDRVSLPTKVTTVNRNVGQALLNSTNTTR